MSASVNVVLIQTRNPLNIGAAARAMSNFGFPNLRLVQPYDVAWREAKSAMKGAPVLNATQVFDTVEAAIADCSLVVGTASTGLRELKLTVQRLELGARRIRNHPGNVALLFGSEKTGLSNDDLSHCHVLVRIPTRAEHESMNLGQAVALCLYELKRSSARVPTKAKAPAPAQLLTLLDASLLEALTQSAYPTTTSTPLQLRRLVRRMHLNSEDAEIWLGILRQIRWRFKHPEPKEW